MKITYEAFAEGYCFPKDDSRVMALQSGDEFVISFVKKGLELSENKEEEIQQIIRDAAMDIHSVLLDEE